MKNILKSAIIVIVSLVVFMTVITTTAFASESTFEPRLSAPSSSNSYYNRRLNVYSQTGYGMPNCTAYAYGRIYEITGTAPKIKSGNAGSWWYSNIRNGYYEYGQEPKLGAIACWSGHVAVVEEINSGTVTISQSHWGRKYFDTTTYSNPYSRFSQTFYGYIYASDSVLEVEEEEPVVYSYTAEKYEFAITHTNPFANSELTIKNDNNLLMNSHMITNAVI